MNENYKPFSWCIPCQTNDPCKHTVKAKVKVKMVPVINCMACSNCITERTEGAGYALDYFCKKSGKRIAGYVESYADGPQDYKFPKWCPLKGTTITATIKKAK
jgi:hypothetical protein